MRVKFCRVSNVILTKLLKGEIQPTHFFSSDAPPDMEIVRVEQAPEDFMNECFRVICVSSQFPDISGEELIPEFNVTMRLKEPSRVPGLDYGELRKHADHKLVASLEKGRAVVYCVTCERELVEAADPLCAGKEEAREDKDNDGDASAG